MTVEEWGSLELSATWDRFLRDTSPRDGLQQESEYYHDYMADLQTLAQDPCTYDLVLKVQWAHLAYREPDLAQQLAEFPAVTLVEGREVAALIIQQEDLEHREGREVEIQIEGLPRDKVTPIPLVREHMQGKLVAIEGQVRSEGEFTSRLLEALWICNLCGSVHLVPTEGDTMPAPKYCDPDRGGCGKATAKFGLIRSHNVLQDPGSARVSSRYRPRARNSCRVMVEEYAGTSAEAAERPHKIPLVIEGALAGKVHAGQRVRVTGILGKEQSDRASSIWYRYIYVVGVERQDVRQALEQLTCAQEAQLIRMGESPTIVADLVQSFAPTLLGYAHEKKSVLMQLAGAPRLCLPDGRYIRGDSHILIVGDPGTGKSGITTFAEMIAPLAVKASGKRISTAGLTASVGPEQFGKTTQMVVTAGAAVRGNGGILIIGELDKAKADDRNSLHEAMEEQVVTVNLAGIHQVLPARTAILADANPKAGRFDTWSSTINQVNLPPSLLSRFDAIWVIVDKPEGRRDMSLVRHMLSGIQVASYNLAEERGNPILGAPVNDYIQPIYTTDQMRRYLAYVRREITPVLPDDAAIEIAEYYTAVRKKYQGDENIPITLRQAQAIIRFAMSHARLRMSRAVHREDIRVAIDIHDQFLERVARDPRTGKLDIDYVITGNPSSQVARMAQIRQFVQDMDAGAGSTVTDLVEAAKRWGINESMVRESLERLKKDGEIFEPRDGRWKVVKVIMRGE